MVVRDRERESEESIYIQKKSGGELNFVVYCESSFELLVECRAKLLLLTLLPHGVGVDTAGGSVVTGGQDETQQVAVQFLIIVGMATGNLLGEDLLGVLDWADAVHEHRPQMAQLFSLSLTICEMMLSTDLGIFSAWLVLGWRFISEKARSKTWSSSQLV